MKNQLSTVQKNIIGSIIGGVVALWAFKKYGHIQHKWILGALTIAGVVAGANAQAAYASKHGKPTASMAKG